MSLSIRPAKITDIDRITEIAIAGFPSDPQWRYRYPHRKEFPEAHYEHVRLDYERYWDKTCAGTSQMMVAESPRDDAPEIKEVVAFSIWDNPGPQIVVPLAARRFDRPDGDAARMRAYSDATINARQEIFVGRYGIKQMSLRNMVTHPDYWRHGAGRLMLKWGLKLAMDENVAIVMFASPMGRALYETLGFRELAMLHIQVPGEKESLNEISCMAWEKDWDAKSVK